MTPDERRDYARTMFEKYPELFPESHRQPILKGLVTVGMAPFEARLAGGAFSYKVIADKSKWPDHSDPLQVMWAQSAQADSSEIWMTFKNSTQFSEENCSFRVHFERGRAVVIQKLEE